MKFAEAMKEKVNQQKAIMKVAQEENRGLSEEEQSQFNALNTEIDGLENSINIENSIRENLANSPVVAPLNDGAPTEITADSVEYKNAWLNMMKYPDTFQNDAKTMNVLDQVNSKMNASADATGYFVPTTIASDIISLMWTTFPILQDVRNMNVKGNFTMNVHTGVTANDAKSVADGEELIPVENGFVSITLGGFSYGECVEIPWSMRAMDIAALEQYLRQEIALRLGAKLAHDIWYGGGLATKELTGIYPTLHTSTDTTRAVAYTGNVTYAQLVAAMASTSLPIGTRIVYLNEETYWNQLATMVDGVKRPLFITDPTTGNISSVLGFKVKIDNSVMNNDIFVGKPMVGYIVNTNQPIATVAQDEVKFRRTNVVGWCVIDGTVVTEKAWCLLEKATV